MLVTNISEFDLGDLGVLEREACWILIGQKSLIGYCWYPCQNRIYLNIRADADLSRSSE